MSNYDSDGYQLVEKEFTFKGHTYSFLDDLGSNWYIYRQLKDKMLISYELVHLERQEEYTIAGVTVPKKWTYPGAAHWGTRGFTYKSLEECHEKFRKLQNTSELANDSFKIPVGMEFTIKDLAAKFNLSYSNVYSKVKEVESKLKVVGTVKNKTGRDTKIYILEYV